MLKPPPSRVNSNSLVTFPFPNLPVIPRPKKRRKCRRKITKCTFKKAFRMFWRWMKKLERRKKRQRRRRRKNKKNRKRNQNYNSKDYRDQSHQTFLQTFRKPLPINWSKSFAFILAILPFRNNIKFQKTYQLSVASTLAVL